MSKEELANLIVDITENQNNCGYPQFLGKNMFKLNIEDTLTNITRF